MKKLTAYYLLLLYASSLAKPFTVWFADVMAHSYFGHQHMTVVHHHEGGRDHVHYQMNKAAKDDAPEQKGVSKPYEDVTVAAFIESPLRIDGSVITKHYTHKAIHLPFVFLRVQLPPPRASFA